ncbi:hypothetical protein GCM10022254_27510 [Actinomadura meridiana]|uniref:Uncharacterized protein n=1 Tax=Actinomadura meridiana TaxID=559626 RepID=A0ABP8BZS6_9ACTN
MSILGSSRLADMRPVRLLGGNRAGRSRAARSSPGRPALEPSRAPRPSPAPEGDASSPGADTPHPVEHARDQRFPLELAGAGGRVDRVLRLTGIDDVLIWRPQPEDALKALNGRT